MRQTTNKNLTKQILTLMLAFIMVFTGMGIGSWGVDTAWADETIPVLTIQKNENNKEIEVVSNAGTELVSIEKKNEEITINGKTTSTLYVATINSGTKFVLKNTIANLRKGNGYWNAENSQTINPFGKNTEYAYDSDLCKSLKTSEAILKN